MYASLRGPDCIAVVRVTNGGGHSALSLSLVEWTQTLGRVPRDFTLAKQGTLLVAANQDTNTLITYRVDTTVDAPRHLVPTGHVAYVPTPSSVCELASH